MSLRSDLISGCTCFTVKNVAAIRSASLAVVKQSCTSENSDTEAKAARQILVVAEKYPEGLGTTRRAGV